VHRRNQEACCDKLKAMLSGGKRYSYFEPGRERQLLFSSRPVNRPGLCLRPLTELPHGGGWAWIDWQNFKNCLRGHQNGGFLHGWESRPHFFKRMLKHALFGAGGDRHDRPPGHAKFMVRERLPAFASTRREMVLPTHHLGRLLWEYMPDFPERKWMFRRAFF